jgi:hypothetical protein
MNKAIVVKALQEAVKMGSTISALLRSLARMLRPRDRRWDMEIAIMVGSIINNLGR